MRVDNSKTIFGITIYTKHSIMYWDNMESYSFQRPPYESVKKI